MTKVLSILQAEWSEFDDNISALVDRLESGEIQNEQLDAAKTELEAYKTKVKEVKNKFILRKKAAYLLYIITVSPVIIAKKYFRQLNPL